jgi:outer membrane protein assembly factor BamB
MRRIAWAIAALGCVLAAAVDSNAQEWPQFRGPNRDSKAPTFDAPDAWPAALNQRWKTEVGLGEAAPVLADGRIYAIGRQGQNEVAICLSAETGDVIWRAEPYPSEQVTGGAGEHPGPRSTPAVGEGKMVTLSVDGQLSCFNIQDGSLAWRKDSAALPVKHPQFFVSASPIVFSGMAIAHLGGETGGALVAYDLTTGQERWKWDRKGASYGSPVLMELDGRTVVVTLASFAIVGVDAASGAEVFVHELEAGQQYMATPLVSGNRIYVTHRQNGVVAVEIQREGDAYKTTQLWASGPGPRYASPVLKDGLIYCATTNNGLIYCLDANTGVQKWIDDNRRGEPASLIDAGEVMLSVSSNSELLAFQPGGESLREIAKFKVAETPVWAFPIVVDNRIFIKDQDSVILWTLQ